MKLWVGASLSGLPSHALCSHFFRDTLVVSDFAVNEV